MASFGEKACRIVDGLFDIIIDKYDVRGLDLLYRKDGKYKFILRKNSELEFDFNRNNLEFQFLKCDDLNLFLRKNTAYCISEIDDFSNVKLFLLAKFNKALKCYDKKSLEEFDVIIKVIKDIVFEENRYNINIFKQFANSYDYIFENIISYLFDSTLSMQISIDMMLRQITFPDALRKVLNIDCPGYTISYDLFLKFIVDSDALDLVYSVSSLFSSDNNKVDLYIRFKEKPDIPALIYIYVANRDDYGKPVVINGIIMFNETKQIIDQKFGITSITTFQKNSLEYDKKLVGSWEFNVAKKILFVNEQTARMLDLEKCEYSVDEFSRYWRGKIKDYYQIFLGVVHSFRKNGSIDFDFELIQNNENNTYRVFGLKVIKEEDKSLYAIGYIKNITDIINKENDELKNQKMLSLGSLASGVAHDFNNSLMATFGYIDFMKNLKELPKQALDYLYELEKISRIQADTVSKLLNYTKESNASIESIDLKKIVEDVTDFSRTVFSKKIYISYECNLDEAIIRGNKSSIQNALFNIYVNAKDAIDGSGIINVNLSKILHAKKVEGCIANGMQFVSGNYYKVDISDNGCGIEESNQKNIFNQFFTTKNEKGSGIGLKNVYKIINESNGFISYDSTFGVGTTFHIYFPVSNAKIKQIDEHIESDKPEIDAKLYHILVIDDDPLVNSIIQESLKIPGYIVTAFTDQFAAIEYYKVNFAKIDLVLLDMLMPGMNGDEVFEKMCEYYNRTQVIILSGFNKEVSISGNKIVGINKYLQKPIVPHELNRIVGETIMDAKYDLVDQEIALLMLSNSEKIYHKMLNSYIINFSDFNDEIEKLLGEGKYEDIRIMIHRLRGISLNIGCRQLYRISSYIDENLKNGVAFNHIRNYLDKLLIYNIKVIEIIKEIVR